MTSYSVERPTRSPRVRPGLAHLRAGQVTTGQPVTVRTLDTDGREIEFPAVTARTELEARYEALKQVRAKHGERANWSFTLHSVKREG